MGSRVKRGVKRSGRGAAVVLRIMAGGGAGALVCVLLLLVCSVCISAGAVGERAMGGVVPVCALMGGICAALTAVRGMPGQRLPVGLCAGAVMFLILLLAGLMIDADASLENGGIGLLLACCGGGALASLPGHWGGGGRRR